MISKSKCVMMDKLLAGLKYKGYYTSIAVKIPV